MTRSSRCWRTSRPGRRWPWWPSCPRPGRGRGSAGAGRLGGGRGGQDRRQAPGDGPGAGSSRVAAPGRTGGGGRAAAGCNAMTDDDALGADMHPLLGPLEPTPVDDPDLLERLLDSRLNPASAPPGYGGLVRLLAAATAPAAPEELVGEQLAMATFTAQMRSQPPTLSPRRTAVPRKILTMKAAAAALVAALSIGGVAAAAGGLLPDQASPVAD